MAMCRVFSCVVGRGCLLWPVHFLGKTLLVFALLHSAFQGQICLVLKVFPSYGVGNEDNGNLLQKIPYMYCYIQCPQPWSRPPQTHTSLETVGHSRASLTLGSVSCGVTAPFSWVLVYTKFCLCPLRVCFPVLCKFWWLYCGIDGDLLQEGLCHILVCCTQSPCPCGRPLLTRTSTGDTQTQLWLSLCGVFGSWCTQSLFEQSCPNLWNLMDCSPPGFSVHGILQARILEWVTMPSSRGSFQHSDRTCCSYVSFISGRFFTYWVIREALWLSPVCENN